MALTIENIVFEASAALRDNKPFVVYAKPGQNIVSALFQQEANGCPANDFTEPGFVFHSFDGTGQFLMPEKHSKKVTAAFTGHKPASSGRADLPITANEKAAFETLIEKGIAEIQSGNVGKIVLSRKEIITTPLAFATIYMQLLAAYPTAFRYCWFHPATGLWMGATPEQLLKTEGNRFRTVALAGTQPFLDTEHVLWREKEKAEQQFVTDFIAEGLRGLVSEIGLSEPYTVRAGNLLHIRTDINGMLTPGSGLKKILGILHPTPAVCGYPKADALKFILENEGYDREFYSGFLGEISQSGCDLYVNLRCMKLNEGFAELYVGCGITKDSDPKKEFIETANKALTMKKILI